MPSIPEADSLRLVNDTQELLDADQTWGRSMKGYRKIASTNTVARAWATRGAPAGSVVVAEEQSAGRGRLGRDWKAKPGKNLLFSIVIATDLEPSRRSLITIGAGVAVAECLTDVVSPIQPAIKWPNDIMLNGQKCAGMLLETTPPDTSRVVLGIGLNVNQIEFPRSLREKATSLQLETGRLYERPPLFAKLLRHIEQWQRLVDQSDDHLDVRLAFEEYMAGIGHMVNLCLTDDSEPFRGKIQGISSDGALRIQQGGTEKTFHAGDIHINRQR